MAAPKSEEPIRTAEMLTAMCLATDLGMGFPFEHGLHATLMGMRLADLLEVDSETASQTYYACLLMYSGCTTDAEISSRIFTGGLTANVTPVQFGTVAETARGVLRAMSSPDLPRHQRAYQVVTRLPMAAKSRTPHFTALCEVASMIAERLGLPASIHGLFAYLTERWDGQGVLQRAKGEEIPRPLRIVHVAREAAYQRLLGGEDHATAVVGRRAGLGLDPEIAEAFVGGATHVLAAPDGHDSAWEATLAAEPRPWLTLQETGIDRALAALGDFADLASPSLSGHSAGVSELARSAAAVAGFGQADVDLARRAALIHDVGRVAVHPATWLQTGRLTADEWEQVRLHPYHTERIFSRSELLGGMARIGGGHHERLDGSGYHRGVAAASLQPLTRLVAVADAFQAMTEPRPHREAFPAEQAARALADQPGMGCLDPDLVAAVIEAAGQPVPLLQRPAGLTERECEVIGLLARGLQTKQVARILDISAKTADTHIQNAYRKLNVSTRAAATLFAMEHGLVPSGELPIP